ncbi:MAG: hypothetical protein AAF135_07600, partial [Bacteroidota bacterium]
LSGLLETWLAIDAFRKDEDEVELYILKAFNNRWAKDLFKSKYKKAKRKLEAQPQRDNTYHRKLHQLLRLQLSHAAVFGILGEYGLALVDVLKQLEKVVTHEQMQHIMLARNYLLSHNKYLHKDLIKSHLYVIQNKLNRDEIDKDPVLRVYNRLIRFLDGEEVEGKVEEEIREGFSLFHWGQQTDIYIAFLNYHIRNIRGVNHVDYHKKIVEILEWGMEVKIFGSGINTTETIYRHLIIGCIHSHQVELGEYYLEVLKDDLLLENREEIYRYCKGRLYMAQGKYTHAVRCLNKKFTHLRIEYRARKHMIEIRYEQGERIELENEIRTLIQCIERQDLLAEVLKRNLKENLQLLDRLIRSFKRSELQKLRQEVREKDLLSDRTWLLEKIDEKLNCVHTPLLD